MSLVEDAYVQKSKLFLMPLLEIKRDPVIMPINTYILDAQKGFIEEDYRLILPFEKEESSEFNDYENHLVGSPYFDSSSYYETSKYRVYVYDLKPYAIDYNRFVEGKYTTLTQKTKSLINLYWGRTRQGKFIPHSKIESYLSPTILNYEEYANDLGVPLQSLMAVRELLDPPNLDKETFVTKELIGDKS